MPAARSSYKTPNGGHPLRRMLIGCRREREVWPNILQSRFNASVSDTACLRRLILGFGGEAQSIGLTCRLSSDHGLLENGTSFEGTGFFGPLRG